MHESQRLCAVTLWSVRNRQGEPWHLAATKEEAEALAGEFADLGVFEERLLFRLSKDGETVMVTNESPRDGDHPACTNCGSTETDVIEDPLGIEPTTIECYSCEFELVLT